jgi:hypothetical protein
MTPAAHQWQAVWKRTGRRNGLGAQRQERSRMSAFNAMPAGRICGRHPKTAAMPAKGEDGLAGASGKPEGLRFVRSPMAEIRRLTKAN